MAAEGDQYMSLAITPTNAVNRLVIDVRAQLSSSVSTTVMIMALFQDAVQAAINAVSCVTGANAASSNVFMTLLHEMAAGTTSSTEFKMRAGVPGGTTNTFNGANTARTFGGVNLSSIRITEVCA